MSLVPRNARILGASTNLIAAACLLASQRAFAASTASDVIDNCKYDSDAAAAAAWRPMKGSAEAATGVVGGEKALRLRCRFVGNEVERASWDRSVNIDLSHSRGVQFKVFCRNTAPVSFFSFYLQTGAGWYSASFDPEAIDAWSSIEIEKQAMHAEGRPAGWDQVKTIRISAWRGAKVDTEFYISDIRKLAPPPSTPRELAQAAIDEIGGVASFNSYAEAARQIGRFGAKNENVNSALEGAAKLRTEAIGSLKTGKFEAAQEQASQAKAQLERAFCLAQKPEPGEFRAFWCHSAFGVKGLSWDEAIRRLAENGFTAILPNMLWGGAAFYDSKVLPVAAQAAERGDQVRECLAACRKYGLQLHVWKVNWNLGTAAPKAFVERLRREGRLQASSSGQEQLWLCPSHPANQQLEIDSLLEVVRNYDVDGVHFDYIRYPDADHCFCAGCRERFQRGCGVAIQHWPQAVLAGGPWRARWLDWRRGNITKVVAAVSQQAHALKPKIKISAAVFRHWETDRDHVGQDWKVWCDKGYLDFVCPMDYTPSNNRFENMVTRQLQWAGKVPCYPGIGASASASKFGADRVIEQINIARRHHTGGFVVFNYGVKESQELVPLLGLGITRR